MGMMVRSDVQSRKASGGKHTRRILRRAAGGATQRAPPRRIVWQRHRG